MAKKRQVISDKRVNTLLRRIDRIRGNYKKNIEYLNAEYAPMFKKSTHFERTDLKQDKDIFDIRYEMIMSSPRKIKTNKSIRKKAEEFIRDYKALGMYRLKTTERHFSNYMRDEWLDNFENIGADTKLINRIKQLGLWNDRRFWKGFFNSKKYIPLYRKYSKNDKEHLKDNELINEEGESIWGRYLEEYLDEIWLNKNEE